MRRDRIRVSDPPEINPIGVNLMIRHQDHAFPEINLQHPVSSSLMQKACDGFIATYADGCWGEKLGHFCYQQAEVRFHEGLPGVVVGFGDEVDGDS